MTTSELTNLLIQHLELSLDYMDDEAKSAKQAELEQYVETAKEAIQYEGVDISVDNALINRCIIMYAGWLYENRKVTIQFQQYQDTSASMPRMLRYNLNNLLFSQKIKEST